MIPTGLAKLLGRLRAAATPQVTADMRRFARGVTFAGESLPPGAAEAWAAREVFKPYTEPHNRREFFKNAIGLPQRGKQLEFMTSRPEHYALHTDAWGSMLDDDMPVADFRRLDELEAIARAVGGDDNGWATMPSGMPESWVNGDDLLVQALDLVNTESPAPVDPPVPGPSFMDRYKKRFGIR